MAQALTLLTWPDYVSPQTLRQFEAEQHVHVRLEIVPSAAELIGRMQSGAQAPDVLVPPDYAVRELRRLGRLHLLDQRLLPNLKNLEPRFVRGRPHDPAGRFSVVKDWGTTGFLLRADRIRERARSWSDFWKLAEKYPGRTTVLDSPAEVIGAALKMGGHSYNSAASADLAEARMALLRLKPHLLAFETDYKPLLAAGQAWLALGWNGDAAVLRARRLPIRYVVPLEGSQIWEDDWAIAAGSAQPQLAHAFLNFVLRPEVAAQEARYTRYATGNRAARRLLAAALRRDPSTYPPRAVLQKLEAGLPVPAVGARRRAQLWQEIRA